MNFNEISNHSGHPIDIQATTGRMSFVRGVYQCSGNFTDDSEHQICGG